MRQAKAQVSEVVARLRELDTQLAECSIVAPDRRFEVIFGKMIPYVVQTTIEFGLILLVMTTVFQVPIRGHVVLLFALLLPFTLTMLAFGLLISTKAATRDAAGQIAMGTIIPSIFLSG